MLTLDIAARVSAGMPWPDDPSGPPAERGDAIVLTAEDDLHDTVVPRLAAAGADLNRVVALTAVRTPSGDGSVHEAHFNLAADLPALEEAIAKVGRCQLVVIDPITAYVPSGVRWDSHKTSDVRTLLAPLAALASRTGVAIVLVSHLRKAEGPAMYRTTGSLAFTAAARAVWAVGRDRLDRQRRLFLPVKCNLTEEPTALAFTLAATVPGAAPVVAWEPDPVQVSADEVLAPPPADRGRPDEERQAAAEWLREALADGPRPAKELYEEALHGHGLSRRTVERARRELGVVSYREKHRGPWFWRLPADAALGRHNSREGIFGGLSGAFENKGLTGEQGAYTAKNLVSGNFGGLSGAPPGSDTPPGADGGCPDGEPPQDELLLELPEAAGGWEVVA